MSRAVRITAPSRLHFGLLRFAQDASLSYGGLGMMLDQPATVVQLQLADTWQATGPNAERALAFAQRACTHLLNQKETALSIQVTQVPPAHAGLGSGTQLAMAIAKAVDHLFGDNSATVDALATAVSRGRRSAIGCHGFFQGGLLWELGRTPNQPLAKLTRRLEIPPQWRVLLITPTQHEGLHGSSELEAFAQLPPVPPAVTAKLQQLAEANILPAVEQADFNTFSHSLYQYGHLAGNCFATIQGGPYASPTIAKCIEKLRILGINGVGQSSWGPTIYALTPNQTAAEKLQQQLKEQPEFAGATLLITTPNNQGAKLETHANVQ